jgi:hypothetical protein
VRLVGVEVRDCAEKVNAYVMKGLPLQLRGRVAWTHACVRSQGRQPNSVRPIKMCQKECRVDHALAGACRPAHALDPNLGVGLPRSPARKRRRAPV